MPQLPTITVVTPCESFGSIAGVRITAVSSCVWTSIKPGASASPSASMTARCVVHRELADFADAAIAKSDIQEFGGAAAAVQNARIPNQSVATRHAGSFRI